MSDGDAMIHCPKCGTANRKGSRFCNECGEPLPSTGIRCPMCDTINPVGNVYCQKCDARLVPLSPGEEQSKERKPDREERSIEGFSLPTIPLDEGEDEQQEALPEDWLDQLRGSADQQDDGVADEEDVVEDDESWEEASIPEWLTEGGPLGEASPFSSEPGSADRDETSAGAPASRDEAAPEESQTSPPEEAELTSASADASDRPAEADLALESDEPPPEPADIPEWLKELGPVIGETSSPAEVEPLTTGKRDDASGEQPPLTVDREPGETPDWLRNIAPLAEDEEEEEDEDAQPPRPATGERASEPESGAIQIPDWLKRAQAGEPPVVSDEPEASEELSRPEPPAEEEVETETAAPTGVSPESVAIPSWLVDAETRADELPSDERPVPFTEAAPEVVETPSWLTELMTPTPEEEEKAPPFPEEPSIVEEGLEPDLRRADIPSWVQELRPSQEGGEEPVRGALETQGLLKGLRGVIPSVSVRAPDTFAVSAVSGTNEASRARAELLQSLLGQPAFRPRVAARGEPEGRKSRAAFLVERWLVSGILLLAVLGMLLAPVTGGRAPRLTRPLETLGARNLNTVVNELDAGDPVLVAFDYGPPEAEELDAVAGPVLRHVLDQGAQVSVVSTRPDGLLVADALMTGIGASGDQYTLIGYRPGTATAVSQLLTATDVTPRMLLVLTSQPMPLRLWIEQARALYGDRLTVVTAGSAALEPIASPYGEISAGQLAGAIHGLRGSASYEALRGAAGSGTQRLNALAAGHVAIASMIVVGAVVHAFGGSKGKKT